MRIAYGAGAVAAMSVMAVGLVEPDWTSTADQAATGDSYANDPGGIAALPDGKAEIGLTDPASGKGESGPNANVRHVTRYVYLRPGQTAPPGAAVIAASAAPPHVVRNHSSNSGPAPSPRQPSSAVSATPRPTHAPAATPRPTARPTPRPTPTTRQSGHH